MKLLSIIPKDSAVYHYRVVRPLKPLGLRVRRTILRRNEKIRNDKLAKRLKKQGDIWVIKYQSNYEAARLLYGMKEYIGAKLVIDIDDNIWEIPEGNVVRDNNKAWVKQGFITLELIKGADWVTVSTEPLKQALQKFNQNITVLPNFIDKSEWRAKRKPHKKVRIGWVYSPTHKPDKPIIADALREISKRDDVEIVIFGSNEDIFDFPTTNIPGVKHTEYPQKLRELSLDISVCPLAANEFNRCKSNIKWLESTMAGAAVVASKVYPYEHSIKHGNTGYVCKGKNQWIKHLTWLIENKDLRQKLVRNARKTVLKEYSNNKKWEEFYKYLESEL